MSDIKILVVDDEERMRKLIRDFLVKSGYLVVEAADGEQAYDMLKLIRWCNEIPQLTYREQAMSNYL